MSIAAAYPGVKAVFSDVNDIDPDLKFDVVAWKESGAEVIGWFVVLEHPALYHPGSAPVPANYVFAGYAYCPNT